MTRDARIAELRQTIAEFENDLLDPCIEEEHREWIEEQIERNRLALVALGADE